MVEPKAGETLTLRTLNRTLLERQFLLRRVRLSAAEAIERLVALQAQEPIDPYVGLWSRLEGFDPEEPAALLTERAVVRMTLLRGTIHMVTARDCVALRPVLQPVLERLFHSGSPFGRQIAGVAMDVLLETGRTLLEERPMTGSELGKLLAERWPDYDGRALAYAVQYLTPLVQAPPRAVWGKSGQARFTTAELWLGCELSTETSPDAMVLRYLRAFGPATPADLRAWSGLTGAREVLERLSPQLRTFRDERGRLLYDVEDAPIFNEDVPAPVRFLPTFDNVTLSHADRSRVIPDEHLKRLLLLSRPTVLVDGFVRATWKVLREGKASAMVISPLEPLTDADRVAAEDEGARLLRLLVGDAALDVRFADPEAGDAPSP